MTDGLYQVRTNYFCAGFYIQEGKILFCAPILKKNFDYWKIKSIRIEEVGNEKNINK